MLPYLHNFAIKLQNSQVLTVTLQVSECAWIKLIFIKKARHIHATGFYRY